MVRRFPNIIFDSNGDRMTLKEYEDTLDLATHQNYTIQHIDGSTQSILDAALSLPDACAFDVEVETAAKVGLISQTTENRLYRKGQEIWRWFKEFAVDQGVDWNEVSYNSYWNI